MKASSLSEKINALFEKEEWARARGLIERALAKAPDDHWLLTRLGTTYYEERDYVRALELAQKAHALDPDCPLVLWDLAGALDAVGRPREAAKTYRRLIQKGIRGVAHGHHGEGAAWAVSLLLDSIYRLGLCYEALGADEEALEYLQHYLRLRRLWPDSLYTPQDALRHLTRLVSRPGKKRRRPKDVEQELEKVARSLEREAV